MAVKIEGKGNNLNLIMSLLGVIFRFILRLIFYIHLQLE